MMVTEEIFLSKRGLSDMCIPRVLAYHLCQINIPFIPGGKWEYRVNLRNFLVDSLTLFPLKPPFLLFLCRGWDRILSIDSVYCILKPTRDTLIAVAICVGIHISPDISLWHCDTVTPRHARRPRKTMHFWREEDLTQYDVLHIAPCEGDRVQSSLQRALCLPSILAS